MTTKSIGRAKLQTTKNGKTKLVTSPKRDASASRRIAKSKSKRVVSRAKASATPAKKPKPETITFQYTDLTGKKPKVVTATRTVR